MVQRGTEPQRRIIIRSEPVVRLTLVDQRTAERLPLELPITYTVRRSDGELSGQTTTLNVSGSGVELLCHEMLPPPSTCRLALRLPADPEPVQFEGQIVWCRQTVKRQDTLYQVGIAFVVAEGAEEAHFARYCHFIASELLRRYLG